MEHALIRAREFSACIAWLDFLSINAPVVRAYRRLGFTLCGLGALFMSWRICW
ncbi:hypothetical protein ACH427_03775 [Streptomyces sp. NPDC020379]|uniref:hypothetical protein n=1 Tax=Streptomyces sp. NPDC020379 TaxID=3365071 RepID=UPI00379C4A52